MLYRLWCGHTTLKVTHVLYRSKIPGEISRGGDSSCFSCPIGWAVNNENKVNRAQCVMCKAGTRSVDMECVACESGKYQPDNEESFCLLCIPGQFNNKSTGEKVCQNPENAEGTRKGAALAVRGSRQGDRQGRW